MNLYTKYSLILFSFLFSIQNVKSQNIAIDSLENELFSHPEKDTARVKLLTVLINQIYDIDVTKAEHLIKEVEFISNHLNYKLGIAHAIYYKGHVEVIKSNFETGIQYFTDALNLYKSENYKKGISYSLNGTGIAYYHQGDYNKAIEYYSKSATIDNEQNDLKGVAGSYNNIGNIYADKGQYDKAISYYIKAKEIKEQIEDFVGLGRSYGNIGSVYGEQGNFPKALENFNKALEIFDEMKYDNHILLLNISSIYQLQKNYTKAVIYLNRAISLNKKQNNKNAMASCLNVLGDIKKEQFFYDKSLALYTEALTIYKKINNQTGAAKSLINIADIQLTINQKIKAIRNYKAALVINLKFGSQLGISKSYLGMAKVYYEQTQYNKATKYTLKSQKIATELELISLQKECAELLSKIYGDLEHYGKALVSYKQFKQLNDSLFNEENVKRITQLEYEYKYEKELKSANTRMLNLTKSVKLTTQDLKKSQRNSFIAIIVILLISIASTSIIFLLKLRHVNAKNQNIAIEQKLLRSQMTPHFIFNSLSVLQGMILNKEEKTSIKYLSKFSKLLRTILENSRQKTVPLSSELAAIESYITLQNLDGSFPYEYTLSVDFNIESDLFLVPPMLIQPFVENAIEHAFPNQKTNKIIKVKLTYKDKKLICTILDNGVGANGNNFKIKHKKNSLATTITAERLILLSKDFKMKGNLTIKNRQEFGEQGTLVTLVIPYKINSKL